jgi:hypothetical protein
MTVAEAEAPLGYRETVYSVEAGLAPSEDFLRFLTGARPLPKVVESVAAGTECLESLFLRAAAKGLTNFGALDELDESEFELRERARPAGYCAQTLLQFGRLGVNALLDYGATCSGMPEEVAVSIIAHALQCVERGDYRQEDDVYPVVRMHKLKECPSIDGIAARSSIRIQYAMVLRAEFVPVGATRGPYRDLYFEILPRGACQVPGCIIGFPVLDAMPYGLGHEVDPSVHTFAELGVALPRLELARREEYSADCKAYNAEGIAKPSGLRETTCLSVEGSRVKLNPHCSI